jgi:mRNA interferase MazF
MRLRRGEVWWVRLDPTLGAEINKTRPCVIVSNNHANDSRLTVMVVPLSTSPRAYPPFTVAIHCAGKSVSAIVDQTRAVAKERFVNRQEIIAADELQSIEAALVMLMELQRASRSGR